jgi:hypothetical protein
MNTDPHELIQRYIAGTTTDEEARTLQDALKRDAEFADLYLSYMNLDVALEAKAEAAEMPPGVDRVIVPPQQSWTGWFRQMRPLTAAAAGLAVGLFSASMVFGFVVQRAVEKRTPLAVFEPGFESPQMPLANGFPTATGQWSGDAAQVVAAENGVLAKEGKFMLRLEPLSKGVPRIYQVLDLQSLASDAGGESREIEVSASFAAAGTEASVRYVIRAFGVTEAPESLDAAWFDRREESIASATKGLDVTAGVTGWQTVSVKIQVPRAARSLVLFFGTRTPDKAARTVPHYLDDVHVSLITPPLP